MSWLYVVCFALAMIAGASGVLAFMVWERLDDAMRVIHDWKALHDARVAECEDLRNRLMYAMEKPWMGTIPDAPPPEPLMFVMPDPGPENEETWASPS